MRLSSDTMYRENEEKEVNNETQKTGRTLRRGGEDRKDREGAGKGWEKENARKSLKQSFSKKREKVHSVSCDRRFTLLEPCLNDRLLLCVYYLRAGNMGKGNS